MTCNRGHRLQLQFLCMVAFFGYNIQLDLEVIHDVIHQEGYKAEIQNDRISLFLFFDISTSPTV